MRNTTDAWTAELNLQIAMGPRRADASRELQGWVLRDHLLEATLPDFDALIAAMTTTAVRLEGNRSGLIHYLPGQIGLRKMKRVG